MQSDPRVTRFPEPAQPDPRIAVKFEAFAIGMRTTVGDFNQMDLDALVAKAEQMLGSNDALTRAVMNFAAQIQLVPFDRERQADLARNLMHFVDTQNTPEPPDLGRKDIHG